MFPHEHLCLITSVFYENENSSGKFLVSHLHIFSPGAQVGNNQLSGRRIGDILPVLTAGDGSLMPGAVS